MTNRSDVTSPVGRFSFGRMSIITAAALVAVVGTSLPAAAQPANSRQPSGATAPKASDASLLDDFIHYTRIRNYELAAARGQELLDRNPSNADIVAMVETGDVKARFEDAVQQNLMSPVSQSVAGTLNKAYEMGRTERARNPAEIERSIKELSGTARSQMYAQQRLQEAGEYAMPQLMEAFLDRSRPGVQPRIQMVMQSLGRQAIIPLVTALPKLPPPEQERVADLLGRMQWRTSVPFLSDLAANSKVQNVREAANRAVQNLGGGNGSVGTQYRNLAEDFYNEKSEVTSFPDDEFQLLWDYQPGGGLTPMAIRTPVYHEAMAMRLAERAMEVEGSGGSPNPETIALWVAANFSREIDSPENYQNPAYPTGRRSAPYYAVAAGADVSQLVLARALDSRDTPLARRALEAVEKTAGARSLWSSEGRVPLLEALRYPSRRVQYEAALALAAAQPQGSFAGSDRVVPVLASSVRGATSQYAVVITNEPENYQTIRKSLTAMGYTVLPQGRTFGDVAQPMAEAPAVDLVVSSGINGERVPALISEVRSSNKTAATPVLVLTNNDSYNTLRHRYATDGTVAVRQVGLPEDAMNKTVTDLLKTGAGGPVTEQEARQYAQRSLSALRDLAVSGNQVLNVSDAALPLIGVLNDPAAPERMKVAEVLSRIGQERAQRSVMEAALAAKGADRVAMLGFVADSAKRFGNMLDVRQVSQVVEMASKGEDEEATSAAALMGALNLPNADFVQLISQKQ